MKFKKISASLTALACCAGIIATFPQALDQTYAAEYVHNDFETNYDGWYGTNTDAVFEAVNGEGFGGSRGMKISERTSPEDGLASSKGFYLVGGIDYKYNVKVFSETDEVFHVSLLYKDLDTDEETVIELASQKVKAGEWKEISADYKAPKNTYEYLITVTNESTNDFVIDDVSITSQKPVTVMAAPSGKGLKDEFADYFRVGNILNGSTVNNSAIKAIMLKDHNAIECENETKPDATIVQNGSTDTNVKVSLSRCASILDFCAQNNIAFRGHTLVWHSQTPEWFFKQNFSNSGSYVSSSVMDQRMESYIKNMFNAYATQYPSVNLYAYDVCNEVIYDGTAKNGGLRPTNNTEGRDGSSAWVRVYGNNSFVEKAFTYARKYAPANCKLYYNDYNEFAYDKKECIKNTILIPLHNKGLLDGMGMQSHIDCSTGQYDWGNTKSYLDAMDDYLSLGIDVQVTELDISRDGGKYTDQQQAEKYKAIFQHCVDVNTSGKYKGKVTLVQVWGPNDNNSWVGTNKNGQPNYPLLYNGNNQPKTAYNYITSIIPDSQWGDGSNYAGDGPVVELKPGDDGSWFHSTFEGTDDGWAGRGGASVMTSGRTYYAGKEALLVQERTSAWQGAEYALSPRIFKPGEEYSFSVNVSYFDGEDTTKFKFTLQYKGLDDETHYSEIASGTGVKGEWIQLANTNYKIPEDASDMRIYVETSDESTENFYIDEAYGAVAGTVIDGAGQPALPKAMSLGDINYDGAVDIFDVILAKQAYVAGKFDDNAAAKAADVDKSGKFEVNDVVLIYEFVTGKIKEFPVAAQSVDIGAMEKLFKSITVTSSYKKENENNPLTTQRFGADPGWMVYDGRLYLYTTNDAFEYKNGKLWENSYDSGTINCISSADLVNWTDHGAIPVAGKHQSTTNPTVNGAASWANRAWAPDACWKKDANGNDKFYLYFANSGGGIGVLTADSPTGPWKDPIGKPLLDWNTPGNSGVVWMFDPGVYYDETTNEGYIAFGGGVDNKDKANPMTGRIAKLGDNMISINGSTKTMETPYLFEDSSLIKIGDTWYYSYCTNWNVPGGTNINGTTFGSGEICYMTSKNPMGDGEWKKSSFKGKLLPGTGVVDKGGNNHHSLIYFKNNYYVAYHTRAQALRMGITAQTNNGGTSADGNYRSTHLDKATFNPSTGQVSCNITMTGVSQIESLNPYVQNRAATMSNQSKDIVINGVGNTTVSVKKGSFTKVSGVAFSKGADTVTVRASSKSGAAIKITTGSTSGDVLAYVEIPAGGSMEEVTAQILSSVSGNKDVYFVYSGDMELDWWQFA